MSSRLVVDRERVIAPLQPTIFGGFLEHMGRAIYEGIYDPQSPLASADGIRQDVLAALKELNPSVIRYPGGNFLSGYNWLDGVGPKEQRPLKRDKAWFSLESNQFGTDDFMAFCQQLGTRPMLGVNLGTGTIEQAGNLVEYCNAPAGSYYADLRVRNGHAAQYGVEYWCLGNEMDGAWQIGHLEAGEYARKAREAAKLMRWNDSAAKLIVCGSSSVHQATYPEWDREVLETCWENVDYLSLHYYAANHENDSASYLAMARQFEDQVDTLAATLRYVQAKLRSKHRVYLSWDEWNVWYKNQVMNGGWAQAPHLIEEEYNLEDALVVAQWMNVFLRRCGVLHIACLAQLVNVIAPILTRRDGLLKQTIFYPFKLFRRFAGGAALDVLAQSPNYETKRFGPMPLLDASASYDEANGCGAVFLVNRALAGLEPTVVEFRNWTPGSEWQAYQLAGVDPKAANTFDHPNRVVPTKLANVSVSDGKVSLALPPLSFTVLASGPTREG